ncbi:hypothetical protein [Streptomyces sp. NBC_01477]|nr:hypothetical protein [Streptomyces sp. NBC_01477]
MSVDRFTTRYGTRAGGEDGDGHPGTPWTPPQEPPSPDGDTPPGDGTHRK